MGSEALYKLLLDNVFDGVYSIDADRRITYWNKGAERISGYSSSDVMGARCGDGILVHVDPDGKPLCGESCLMAACMRDGQAREAHVFMHHKDGHRMPVAIHTSAIKDDSGQIIGAVQAFSENAAYVFARRRIEELEELALLDELTRIGNRRYVETNLAARLGEFERYGWTFGVLFMDLDYFKWVNDMHGHQVGDTVLKMVANTLSGAMRPSDVVARWGGEEFVAILSNCDIEKHYRIANRFLSLVRQSFIMNGDAVVQVSLSIGGTLVRPNDTPEEIIERADALIYASKSNGRNCITTDSALPLPM